MVRRRSHPADLTDLHILVVEDNELNLEIAVFSLEAAGLNVSTAINGLEAVQLFEKSKPYEYDIILMDIMMPVMDGITALKNLRKRGSNIPVLMLTAKTEIDDKVEGLDNGANDYLTKPFDTRELLARIRVMMRRKPQFTSNQLKIADLILDRDTRKVTRAGNEIDLSAKEFMVLECLMRNKNIVMTRQQIEQNAWDFDFEGGSNVIDVYIRYLRKKIDAQYEQKLIHTVRGVGYVMRENE